MRPTSHWNLVSGSLKTGHAAIARLTANLGDLASVARVALPANVAQGFSALVPSGSKKKPAPAPTPQ